MAASEVERLKELLPKISVKLAGKTENLVKKMKELGIIKDDAFSDDANPNIILEKVAESRNFKIMEHLKDMLTKEGFKDMVLEIEGKIAQTWDSNDDGLSDDFASDSCHEDKIYISESAAICRSLQEMKHEIQEMRQESKQQSEFFCRELQEMRKETSEEAKEYKKREETLLKLISKLESEKDHIAKDIKEIRATGVDEAAFETQLQKCHELESKHNHLLKQMNKKEKEKAVLRVRNQRLETEIAQMRLELISLQSKNEPTGKMYSKFATPDRNKNVDTK